MCGNLSLDVAVGAFGVRANNDLPKITLGARRIRRMTFPGTMHSNYPNKKGVVCPQLRL